MITTLHICNGYSGSKIYMNLFKNLDEEIVHQKIYTPLRNKSNQGKNHFDLSSDSSSIIYSNILNTTTDRIFYKSKISKIFKDIRNKNLHKNIDVVHAHTWYSDGGVGYLLKKTYNIPYIVAIRSTDINIHYKYLFHHRGFGFEILKNASKIVLISGWQLSFFKKKFGNDSALLKKIEVIPNGVDSFWIENSVLNIPKLKSKTFQVLYVGSFIKRKGLLKLQKAILKLRLEDNISIKLTIVGSGGDNEEAVLGLIKAHPEAFDYKGQIEDKNILRGVFLQADIFALPSINETFGLVYVEALLSGLPIIYTADTGIDGLYKENIGVKLKDQSVPEIISKLKFAVSNIDAFEIPFDKLKAMHDWKDIAKKYKRIYEDTLSPSIF
jgi:glycosyltransferase involved in cell wall biosynthesis